MEIRQVGVIGAGQMGGGIAQVCAQAGLAVRLCDIDPAQQARAMAQMRRHRARVGGLCSGGGRGLRTPARAAVS